MLFPSHTRIMLLQTNHVAMRLTNQSRYPQRQNVPTHAVNGPSITMTVTESVVLVVRPDLVPDADFVNGELSGAVARCFVLESADGRAKGGNGTYKRLVGGQVLHWDDTWLWPTEADM